MACNFNILRNRSNIQWKPENATGSLLICFVWSQKLIWIAPKFRSAIAQHIEYLATIFCLFSCFALVFLRLGISRMMKFHACNKLLWVQQWKFLYIKSEAPHVVNQISWFWLLLISSQPLSRNHVTLARIQSSFLLSHLFRVDSFEIERLNGKPNSAWKIPITIATHLAFNSETTTTRNKQEEIFFLKSITTSWTKMSTVTF